MGKWTSTITNDPDDDFRLCIEIEHDGDIKAVIKKIDGKVQVIHYQDDTPIPNDWLHELLEQAKLEIE